MLNRTRNQHFLTRVEQKLNALNPQAAERNQRIYSFRLVNRETYSIALEHSNGRSIGNNLSVLDLYSFDVLGGSRVRGNLESLFAKYEANTGAHTRSLLTKLDAGNPNIKAEIIDLFAAKLLNFVRNPFCIQKVLNTFPGVAQYHPTDPALLDIYLRIASGRKPHQAHLCHRLNISDVQYVEWLRVLFMLLAVPISEHGYNMFEGLIKGLMEDRKRWVQAYVSQYDNDYCLLSDRGYSQPIPDDSHLGFAFNLCSKAFVEYIFADPAKLLEGKAPPDFLANSIAQFERRAMAQLHVTPLRNHLPMLAQYNRRVIEQCYERVYCSARDGIVLD
jgi:hypothetical protein